MTVNIIYMTFQVLLESMMRIAIINELMTLVSLPPFVRLIVGGENSEKSVRAWLLGEETENVRYHWIVVIYTD
jgi:hypothetical protein